MNKIIGTVLTLSLALPSVVLAHAVVKPAEVGVGAFQTFTLGVPSEKNATTVSVRLVVPNGLSYVSPNVMPGWKIDRNVDEQGNVTEITWNGGSIPANFRADFLFSAKVPATEGTLVWKVYQTYADGSTVSWDTDPSAQQPMDSMGSMDFSKQGPYSVTNVVNDLSANSGSADKTSRSLSIAALALSAVAFVFAIRKRRA